MAATAEGALAAARDVGRRLVANVEKVVHGKHDEVALVVAAFAASGHVLLEDVPGTAKTVLARALAASIEGGTVQRIQGTPDLQPTDATGLAVFDPRSREFEFRAGPLFANVILVDEINRAMPRTQSALLEAMAERQVTVDGTTRPLPDPFLLLATENPIDLEGTFPLPEAQLDRFAIRTALGYPDADQEVRILLEQRQGHPLDDLSAAVTIEETRTLRSAVGDVYVDDLLLRWIVDLVRATREVEGVLLGRVRARLAGAAAHRRRARAARRARLRVSGRCRGALPARPRPPAAARPDGLRRRRRRLARGAARARPHRLARARACAARGRGGLRCDRRGRGAVSAAAAHATPFPLVPRFQIEGLSGGVLQSLRRGRGSEPVATRPYRRGDSTRTIDWAASARLSAARRRRPVRRARVPRRGGAARGRRAGSAPRDGPAATPTCRGWTSARRCGQRSTPSARAPGSARARLAMAGATAETNGLRWLGENDRPALPQTLDAPPDALVQTFLALRRRREDLPSGTFVFVVSDFLEPLPPALWSEALARRWDVVPVVVQDPVWEASFPAVGGVLVPVADPRDGSVRAIRLRGREARRLAAEHEERRAEPAPDLRAGRSRLGARRDVVGGRRGGRIRALGRRAAVAAGPLVRARAACLTALAAAAVCAAASPGALAAGTTPALTVRTSLQPQPARFGEHVRAVVEVLADTSRVAPGSVVVVPGLAPLVVLGTQRSEESGAGHRAHHRERPGRVRRRCVPAALGAAQRASRRRAGAGARPRRHSR